MSLPAVLDWDTPCFSNKPHLLVRVRSKLPYKITPFPPKELDWVAPSFTVAENTSDFDIPTPPRKFKDEWERDRFLPPVVSQQEQAASAAWIGGRGFSFDKCLRLSLPLSKPRWVAPSFPFAPKPVVAQVQRLNDTKTENYFEGENGVTRNPSPRLVGTYYYPEFDLVVVGYRTVQAGRPLWSVPMFNTYIIRELRHLLEAPLSMKRVIGSKSVRGLVSDDPIEGGVVLGEREMREPVMGGVFGKYHKTPHKHSVNYFNFDKNHVPVVGYMVYRQVISL